MGGMAVCTSKVTFYMEELAQLRADDINFELGYDKFFVYQCNCCHFYHLTTHPLNK